MQEFNSHNRFFLLCLGILLMPGWVSTAWSGHENLPCAPCHNKTEAQLKDYTHDSSSFPVSDVCLSCHDANMDISSLSPPYVFNGPAELAGGTLTPTLRSDKVGHNIVSIDMILGLTPPGGSTLMDFGCLSCHDAHANGNFRNLKKEINGYQTLVMADSDPNYRENVYISGMDNFCGACHEKFHGAHNAGGGHPVGITIYGARYADFEFWSSLDNRVTEAQYPTGSRNDLFGAEVFCLSCHRAHASSFRDSMRWDYSKNARGCLECHTF
jgi:predicted CXXCH cytochrome family protein